MSQTDYLELLDWTSKRSRANAARLWSAWHQVFQCLSMSGETWSHLENNFVGTAFAAQVISDCWMRSVDGSAYTEYREVAEFLIFACTPQE